MTSEKFELTEHDELGYYTSFDKLFPDFVPYINNKETDKTIIVNFQFTDEDKPPNNAQLRANDFLIKNSNLMLKNLVKYLKQDEEYFMEFYGVYREIKHESTNIQGKKYTTISKSGFPLVNEKNDYINYFGISEINISNSEDDGYAYIGFAGGCPWDQEHGFGAAFHKDKLLHVEDWNYGNTPSWGSRDQKNHLTESFTNFHQLEDLGKRKLRLQKESRFVLIKNEQDCESIFDWLNQHKMIYGYRNSKVDLNAKEKAVLLNEIKELNFYGQKITHIPQALTFLKNLNTLSFSFNQLSQIPQPLFHLLKLKNLSITSNELKEIPIEIGKLKNLEYINLGRNKLISIPEEIGHLEKLKSINLSSNSLSNLPKSISRLRYLEHIQLNSNDFIVFPDTILFNERLKSIHLMSNKLNEIKASISKLRYLEYLDIRYNEISQFPPTLIIKLHALKSLYLSGNKLNINALEELIKSNNKILNSDIEQELNSTKEKIKKELIEKERLLKQKKEAKNLGNRDEQLKYCKRCKHRKMDMHKGLLCGLTNDFAKFKTTCPSFDPDTNYIKKRIEKENYELEQKYGSYASEVKSGKKPIWIYLGIAITIILFVFRVFRGLNRTGAFDNKVEKTTYNYYEKKKLNKREKKIITRQFLFNKTNSNVNINEIKKDTIVELNSSLKINVREGFYAAISSSYLDDILIYAEAKGYFLLVNKEEKQDIPIVDQWKNLRKGILSYQYDTYLTIIEPYINKEINFIINKNNDLKIKGVAKLIEHNNNRYYIQLFTYHNISFNKLKKYLKYYYQT